MSEQLCAFLFFGSITVVVVFVACLFIPRLISNWQYGRPTDKLYVCMDERRKLVGIVRAKDYDYVFAEYWKQVRAGRQPHPGPLGPRLFVQPVILCSTATPASGVIGNEEQMKLLLKGCSVEQRQFYVPTDDLDQRVRVISWASCDDPYQFVHRKSMPRNWSAGEEA